MKTTSPVSMLLLGRRAVPVAKCSAGASRVLASEALSMRKHSARFRAFTQTSIVSAVCDHDELVRVKKLAHAREPKCESWPRAKRDERNDTQRDLEEVEPGGRNQKAIRWVV